jgi:signal transduction histidine kinase/HPt (histidine-containing phosphotransfer) domain-containing protein/ActR/RegA family two-component response regulator
MARADLREVRPISSDNSKHTNPAAHMSQHPRPSPPALQDLLSPEGFSVLRHAAATLYEQRRGHRPKGAAADISIHDMESLIEELRLHQIELELQNESLRATRNLLEQSLQRYEDLYQDAPVALLTLSEDGTIREANQSAATLLDEPRSALIGRRLGLWISEDRRPAFNALLADVQSSEHRLRLELSLALQPRPTCWVLAEAALAKPTLAGEIRLALTDISERKALEEQLRQGEALWDREERLRTLNAELEARVATRTAEANAANAAKSHFLAHMSHEIRTPLNVILGLAQLLEQGELNAQQQHQVRRIQEAGESLLGILDDTLDLSRIEAGKLGIAHQPFELHTLLARLESIQGRCARAKGLSLNLDIPPLPAGAILGDPLRLEQVLNNLIGNAIKFTNTGGIELRIQAREAETDSPYLHFEVEDTGIGIEPQILEDLFQPFVQADTSLTRNRGGTGLGLAISKHLVELMSGKIGAVSQPGRGSIFWFDLPFEHIERRRHNRTIPTPRTVKIAASALSGWRVLVVDDSPMNQEIVEQALDLAGAAVILADDGAQALQRLRSDPEAYQAVLMDIQMPVMDGLTATRRIRQELNLHDLPIIGLSAGVLPHERQAALEAGMNDVLNKPIRLTQMITTLLHWSTACTEVTPPATGPIAPTDAWTETFPAIPGIDRQQAAEILCGNRTMFRNLLGLLATDGRDLMIRVRQDLDQERRQEAATRLHNLKGHAGSLGALAIQDLAKRLEEAIDRGEQDLDADLEGLNQQLRDLIEASAPWLKS